MRNLFISLLSVLGILNVSAQNQANESLSIDAAINACIAMRDAVANNDSAAIKQSAKDLKAAGTTSFNSLRCKDDRRGTLTLRSGLHPNKASGWERTSGCPRQGVH